MYLRQCAVCATDLGFTLGKKCGRCSTRYCGSECQVQHWKEGGHDQLCKLIKRAGGAEQYNANNKYAEAVAVAVEVCAADTKGQTCYICTQALHWKTKEGLVRMCACRGTAGFAHVSCLAEQAKILFVEAEENNLDSKRRQERWDRWSECSLCEQQYHGVVKCALGWACWKTYVGRPQTNETRCCAMNVLGLGLTDASRHEDALSIQEAELTTLLRIGAPECDILAVQSNIANRYDALGRDEQALCMRQKIYSETLNLLGKEHINTLQTATSYASSLQKSQRYAEAKSLLRKISSVARRALGENHELTLKVRKMYAASLRVNPDATLDETREAIKTLEEIEPIARRVLGGAHPLTKRIECGLRESRAALHASEPSPESASSS